MCDAFLHGNRITDWWPCQQYPSYGSTGTTDAILLKPQTAEHILSKLTLILVEGGKFLVVRFDHLISFRMRPSVLRGTSRAFADTTCERIGEIAETANTDR